jgi:surfeit locus 1 family protein
MLAQSSTPIRAARFRPLAWLGGLLALAAAVGFVLLGQWQSQRAEFKRDRVALYAERAQGPVVPYLQANQVPDLLYQRVSIEGRLAATPELLLDNQMRNGVAGVRVFTPLFDAKVPLIVDRGWAPRTSADRAALPNYPTDSYSHLYVGTLVPPPSPGLQLAPGPTALDASGRTVVTAVDAAALDLLGPTAAGRLVLKLDANQTNALTIDDSPLLGMAPEKHDAYAFQWRALAAGVLVAYVVLLMVDRRRKPL